MIWRESRATYGLLRIHAALLAEGERVGRKRVARLMRELDIEGVTRRRFKTGTTKRQAWARPAPYLVDRDFSAGGPDQLWVADEAGVVQSMGSVGDRLRQRDVRELPCDARVRAHRPAALLHGRSRLANVSSHRETVGKYSKSRVASRPSDRIASCETSPGNKNEPR